MCPQVSGQKGRREDRLEGELAQRLTECRLTGMGLS
jgi:hypothetical protein